MKRGVEETAEKRYELLKMLMEQGASPKELLTITEPMRDMTDSEKEAYAEQKIEELNTKRKD